MGRSRAGNPHHTDNIMSLLKRVHNVASKGNTKVSCW
ncbi:hypothetical protein CPT_Magnus_039 [Klebsiella phage Magnus]|uniref:Uncharacterized protein n=3 Tax=Taipeivirus TaxID=2731621 RepID=A0A482N052_9CAUD|nr:hypothetical protein HOS54_gp207 [Klebsiella phage Menlow]YP_009822504.1 hypothetical protein HOV43_gp220 [Escherichia phage vB_EcoM_KWBSE43-6]YP_009883450.1 hypothetical protein HYP92_gp202 [Klebsiella phage Magnus]AUG87742.1 hypothetical protein CPT_Menlow_041 [Klebsiella phage Menlow]QBQ78963.1 hypothetical protein KWBSE43_00143 [Escherichia phage vB_EcoM_KWBSE43-6]QEG07918.1 hypothetical protein CPT_Magnus_039 [Klebsiella phage Magnus]